jgi:hypothetical protein
MANRRFNTKTKAVKRRTKTDSDIHQDIQDVVLTQLQDNLIVAVRNMDVVNENFNEYYNMLHCIREKKPNDWESDISLPEFTSRLLTQVGGFVGKYFQSRDYVETDDDTADPKLLAEAKAAKGLLNTLLNDPNAHYFQKTVRLLMFTWPSGWGVIKGGYQQKIERYVAATTTKSTPVLNETGEQLAEEGGVYEDPYLQKPMMEDIEEDIYDNRIIEDRPTFDVYPNQNVYFSPEYAYSLNDKEYVIFEDDSMSLDKLESLQEQNGYFNLHILKDMKKPVENEKGGKDTWNKDNRFQEVPNPPSPKFRILEFWQKYPVVVKAEDQGVILDWEPGYTKAGVLKSDAELRECIITTATATGDTKDSLSIMIGFKPSRHTKRPMVRFLCYIDALSDSGFGDGELTKELQIAIDDNFNLSNFRTKLATTPAFKRKRYSMSETHIKIAPETPIDLEDINDLQEIQISDNIQGAMIQNQMLATRMDYSMATSPQTMGHGPERAETATQAGIVSQRAETRIGMKTTILEMVGFTEFYDMLLTLCNDFMLPTTLEKMVGPELAYNYNPNKLNLFRPVSQALETEESKNYKIRVIDQLLGRVVNFPNPKTPMVVNYLMGMAVEALGKNWKHFQKFMFSEDPEINLLYQIATGGNTPGLQQIADMAGGGASNEQGVPQGQAEQNTRQMIGG